MSSRPQRSTAAATTESAAPGSVRSPAAVAVSPAISTHARVVAVEIRQQHRRAGLGEAARAREADAAGGAGHQGDVPVETRRSGRTESGLRSDRQPRSLDSLSATRSPTREAANPPARARSVRAVKRGEQPGSDPLGRADADRPLRRRALGRARRRPRGARRSRPRSSAPASTPREIEESSSAAPTRRARTTATSRGWPCCSPGCPSRCRA